MKKSILLLVIACIFSIPPLEAAFVKQIHIDSDPVDAEVFLLQGARRIPLGKTPLKYEASFHSEISILRIAFEKAGFEGKVVEVSATQNSVQTKLNTRVYASTPDSLKDPVLRNLQQRIKPIIDKFFSEPVATQSNFQWAVGGQVNVAAFNGKTFIILPIALTDSNKNSLFSSSSAVNNTTLRALWDQLSQQVVFPLSIKLKHEDKLSGLIVEIANRHPKKEFQVGSRVETKVEMECIAGTEMVQAYDSCATKQMRHDPDGRGNIRMSYVCVGGMVTRSVYNPCLYRTPISKSSVVIDPVAKTEVKRSKIQFIFTLDLLNQTSHLNDIFSRLGILCTNEEGRTVLNSGPVPPSLSQNP